MQNPKNAFLQTAVLTAALTSICAVLAECAGKGICTRGELCQETVKVVSYVHARVLIERVSRGDFRIHVTQELGGQFEIPDRERLNLSF